MIYATRAIGFLGLLAFATSTPIQLKITFPGAGDAVCIGSGLDVRWSADGIPQNTNPMGTLYYVQDGVPDTDHPPASDFPLSDGHVKFIVQIRQPPGTYQLAMAGYSGTWLSEPFVIGYC